MKQRGFTLVEMLVVILIMGLVSGIAIFAIGVFRDDNNVATTTQELASVLRMAQMEAVFENQEMGFAIDDSGYRFYRRDSAHEPWQLISDDKLFPTDTLPKHLSLQVLVEGQPSALSQSTPQVILSQGAYKPFAIQMVDKNHKEYLISADAQGDIAWQGS